MKITITGRNLSLTDGLKNGVEKKLGKLDKFFQAETPCNVTLSTQKDMQKIEVTIPVKGSVIRAEEATEDMYQSIDLVVDVLADAHQHVHHHVPDAKPEVQQTDPELV